LIFSHFADLFSNFLGLQITNNDGLATFDTVYPGWYVGRAIHMHIKVRIGGSYDSETGLYSGGTVAHTGQLFFNDSFSDSVATQSPYVSHTVRRTLNSQDNIYLNGGQYTLMDVQYENSNLGFPGGLTTIVTLGVTSRLLSTDTTATTTPTTTTTTIASNSESTEPIPNCGSGRVGGRLFWFG
jgi:hypothetical protein